MEFQEKQRIDNLIQHILHIYDIDTGEEIRYDKIEVKREIIPYSSVEANIIYLDGKRIRDRNYKVQYQCRCGRTPTILLQKYIHKSNIVCTGCIQDKKFEYHVIPNPSGKGKKPEDRKKEEKPINYSLVFSEESQSFKETYEKNHITNEEMIQWWPHIHRISGHDPIKDNVTYFYAVPTNNQMKYTSLISTDDGMTLEKMVIELKCDICGKIFKIHNNNLKHKDPSKIRCQQCSLCNKTFSIKKFRDDLTYQSNSELEFIELCVANNISIIDGPSIEYFWNGSSHRYFSDFYLPEFKRIVEIKGNNIYYRMQMESGKFEKKCEGTKDYARRHKLEFEVVFAENINVFVKKLLNERDSLNNSESC